MFRFDTRSYIGDTKRVVVNPIGWFCPLEVEYGIGHPNKFDTMNSVVWHVVGTHHFFCMPEPYMPTYAKDGYEKHFTETLERFRDDYLSWWEDEKYEGCDWRDEYRSEFKDYIRPRERGENNKRRS